MKKKQLDKIIHLVSCSLQITPSLHFNYKTKFFLNGLMINVVPYCFGFEDLIKFNGKKSDRN